MWTKKARCRRGILWWDWKGLGGELGLNYLRGRRRRRQAGKIARSGFQSILLSLYCRGQCGGGRHFCCLFRKMRRVAGGCRCLVRSGGLLGRRRSGRGGLVLLMLRARSISKSRTGGMSRRGLWQ